MISIGVIGCGKWSNIVINEINKNRNFNLTAIVCRNPKKNIVNKNIDIFKSIKDLIESNKCDSLYVAANPLVNFEVINLINEKPIPIILEKPFSNNYNYAIQMQKMIFKNNLLALSNFPNIYSECFNEIKKIINFNLEHLKEIQIVEGSFGPFRNNINPIWDWGYHSFSTLIHLFSEKTFSNINLKEIKKNNIYGNGLVSKFDFTINNQIKVKIINGNLFKNKIRKMKLFDKNKNIYEFDMINHKILINNKLIFVNKHSPLKTLLNSFHNDIVKNNFKNSNINIKTACITAKLLETFYKC